MPTGKKIDSLRHNSVITVNIQNQSNFNGSSIDSTLGCESFEVASSSNIIPFDNEVTNKLKRPLLNQLNIDAKIKKIRESSEEQFEVNNLNNENIIEEHHISLLIGKLDEIAESDTINGDKNHYVSNDSNNGSSEKNIFTSNFVNGSNNTGTNNQEVCSPTKMPVSKERQKIAKISSEINNDINNCAPQVMKINTESTGNNNIDNYNTLVRFITSENFKDTESSKRNDTQLCKDKNLKISMNNTNGIETIENEPEINSNEVENEISNPVDDRNGEMIVESDVDSGGNSVNFDVSNSNKEYDYDDDILPEDTTKQSLKNMARNVLFELFKEKDDLFERWVSFLQLKCLEYLTDKDIRGRERREVEYILRQQNMWREKFNYVFKAINNCADLIESHSRNFKNITKKIKTLRSVALQVDLCSFKENGYPVESLRLLRSLKQSGSSAVDISSGDDEDLVVVNTEKFTKSSSSNSEINTITKQSLRTSPSKLSTSNKPMVSTTTAVPPAIPINSPAIINSDLIDLTGNDEVNEVPNRLHLDKAFKMIRRPGISTSSSGTTSIQLTKNLSTQALPKNVTFIEIPNLPTSSNYIVKTSTATGSNQLTASSLKTVGVESNSSVQPIVIKSAGKFLPIHISPVVDSNQLQSNRSAVTLTSSQINRLTSQLNSSQFIRPQIITPQIVRPQHAVVQSTRPQFSTVQSIRPQQNRRLLPVPSALSLLHKHPAPLPPLPNQTSLPSWKKLPSAPVLQIKDSSSSGVSLSWVVPKYPKPSIAIIETYQIFAYPVTSEEPKSSIWLKIGEIKALPLPMACSISQLKRRHRYYFAVRAVDIHTRVGPFSLPKMHTFS